MENAVICLINKIQSMYGKERRTCGGQLDTRRMEREMEKQKKGFRLPHVYLIFMLIMVLVVILSFIIPAGQFERTVDPTTHQEIVNPDVFHYVAAEDRTPITFLGFFQSIHDGIVQGGDIVISLLLISGVIYLIETTGAIAAGIHKILAVSEGKELMVIVALYTVFTVMGALGFGEGGMPFFPLCISVVMALGYDRIAGAGTAILGMGIGFASGLINMFTTGIAQSIVGLPLFSGLGFRFGALIIFYIIGLVYLLFYCRKIKKDPNKSIVKAEFLTQDSKAAAGERVSFNTSRILALIGLLILFILQGYGGLKLGWGMPQIAAIYLIFAVVLTFLFRLNPNQVCMDIVTGASRVLGAALAIGFARAIMILMNQAQILDTVVNAMGNFLAGKSAIVTLLLVYLAVTAFNFFVVSGSGKAVMMMPILGPLGKMLNINQQVMVLAYQYGDGFTNYLWPAGSLVALTFCGIEYSDWIKFAWKIFGMLILAAFCIILFADAIGLGPF